MPIPLAQDTIKVIAEYEFIKKDKGKIEYKSFIVKKVLDVYKYDPKKDGELNI